jgi:GTP-binding protein
MFLDYAKIRVEAGDGGHGCIGFRREKFVPKGGPDGGDGGQGGHIIAIGDGNVNTLLHFKYMKYFKAKNGEHGSGKNKSGAGGEHQVIRFPLGSIIYLVTDGEKSKLHEFTTHTQEIIIARGGVGGRGNQHFATSSNQAPRFATDGKPGEKWDLEIELKLMADVGLVGFPNAGKSTLLASISAARPKIADYPFTTLVPMLGVVSVDEMTTFVVADIPGLIEGAADGRGLGIQFLRHIQRTGVLIYLIDIASAEPYRDYLTLKKELQTFDAKLGAKPHLIVLSKIDQIAPELYESTQADIKKSFSDSDNIISISSVSRHNIPLLIQEIYSMIQINKKSEQ